MKEHEYRFAVADAARMLGLHRSTLQDWLASGGAAWCSKKLDKNRLLNSEGIFLTGIAAVLIRQGWHIHRAFAEAGRALDGVAVEAVDRDLVLTDNGLRWATPDQLREALRDNGVVTVIRAADLAADVWTDCRNLDAR
ncbi:MAG TPA: hypothetical protein VGO22_05685 [Pseudorhizobium sp.]|jgi:hypothetical protein|nr:hypothetical protein [Pseudorhizobium sp.]